MTATQICTGFLNTPPDADLLREAVQRMVNDHPDVLVGVLQVARNCVEECKDSSSFRPLECYEAYWGAINTLAVACIVFVHDMATLRLAAEQLKVEKDRLQNIVNGYRSN